MNAIALKKNSNFGRAFTEAVVMFFGVAALMIALSTCSGCATPVYRQNVLSEQFLYPHPGYPGLVNRACTRYTKGDCSDWSVQVQDTSNPQVRANLQRLRFVCDVGGREFYPCADRNGLCRNTFSRKWFLAKKEKRVEFLSLEPGPDKDFLISARAMCHRYGAYEMEVSP